MKILLGYKLILDILLNTSKSNSSDYITLCEIIFKFSHVQFYITRSSLDKIHSLTSMSKSVKDADNLVAVLEYKFTICEGSSSIFENARHRDSEIDEAIDLECCLTLGIDGIVTKSSEIYVRNILPIWSVEKFLQLNTLENSYVVSSSEPFLFHQQNHQLSLPWAGDKSPATYMIRNTMPIITKAITILKTAGFCGLTKESFTSALVSSVKTAKSVIWDLEKFEIASSYRGRVAINPSLLDTGESDLSRYLAISLKDHVIVQAIYKEIEIRKVITKWRLQEIVTDIYSRNEVTKNKSKSDYSSRIISWLIFAKLLEEKGKNKFIIPSVQSSPEFDCPNYLHEQLNLFEQSSIA